MNKKNNPDYQRKDLMVHKTVVDKFNSIARKKKKSTKFIMEEVLSDYAEPIVGPNDERSVATAAQ